MSDTILVTGGTGYIGSHTCVELIQAGHRVVVVDNLSNSRKASLDGVQRITGQYPEFFEADLRDPAALHAIFAKCHPDHVIHFAGLKSVSAGWIAL